MLSAEEILSLGFVPGPPEAGVKDHPVAVDIDGQFGAVSWVYFNRSRAIARGWWCDATIYRYGPMGWGEVTAAADNTTAEQPFVRPHVPTNCAMSWIDWPSYCEVSSWDGIPGYPDRHMFFGIATVGTARLTVTTPDGRERDLRITPWNGAYVAVVVGETPVLTGYDATGAVLGTLDY